MTITMKRLLNLCLILVIFLFSIEVSVAAENSEVGEKGEYIQLASNADSLKEKMDKMDDEEKRLKSQRRVYEQRSKQFKKIMNQLYSKWSKAGLMTDYAMGPDQGYLYTTFNFNCSPRDGGEFGGKEMSIEIKSISFNPKTHESSDDSLDICSSNRRKSGETCVPIAWDEVIDKEGSINLHRIEEESRSAIASFFNLPVDTPLQDIVATQTSLSNDAKKKLQISKSNLNELRLKLENATEKALTKIASKTKVKFYQVSQSDIEEFLFGLTVSKKVEERRKKNKLYSYRISDRRRDECAGEIVDHTVFIIIKAKFGQKGDYIKLILSEEISDHLGHVSIVTKFSYNNKGRNYWKGFDFDPAISAKDVTEALVEDGIAGAVEHILENGVDLIIEK